MRDVRRAQTEYGEVRLACGHKHNAGDQVDLLVRPEPAPRGTTLEGVVRETIFLHDRYRVVLSGGLLVEMDSPPVVGRKLRITVRPECLGTAPDD
jgi:hypothetical protein